jgi:hypothetical protein
MVYSKSTLKLKLEPRISVLGLYLKKPFLYVDVDGRIIRKCVFKNWVLEAWTGLVWLRTGTGGRLLWMWQWKYGFRNIPIMS